MRSGTQVALTITDEALAALNLMATERKRGEFVCKLILAAYTRGEGTGNGVMERIEAKIDRLLSERTK